MTISWDPLLTQSATIINHLHLPSSKNPIATQEAFEQQDCHYGKFHVLTPTFQSLS